MRDAPVRRAGYIWTVIAQLLGRFGNMAANLGSLALIARVLPQDQFGIYVLVTGLVLLLAQIADFGTGPIFGQHAAAAAADGTTGGPRLSGRYWGSFLLLRAALAAMATGICMALSLTFDAGAAGPMLLVSLSVAFVAARFLDPLYQVAHRPFRSTATQLVGAGSVLAATGLVAVLHPTLTWFLLAFVAANVLYVGASFIAARDLIAAPIAIDLTIVRGTLVLAAPIGFAGLMTAVNGRANLLFLDHFQGPDALAIYGAATRVLDLAVNLAVVILWPLIPIFSRSAGAGIANLAAEVRKAVRLLLHLILPLLVASPYLTPIIVRALYGANYAAAAPILDVLAWVGFGVAFALLASYALLSLRITRYAVRITATAVVANLALNAMLVPRYGPMGAAIAAVCTEGVLVSQVMLALLRHVPRSIDGRAILAMLAVAGAGALLLRLLVPYTGEMVVVLVLLPCCYTLLGLLRERRRANALPGAGRVPAALDAVDTTSDGLRTL